MARTLIASLLAAFMAAHAAAAELREFGVGVIAGDPTGGTAKAWLDDKIAFDVGVGFSGDAAFWGDILYHLTDVLPQPTEGKLLPYIGVGPRIETSRDPEFGLRAIAGLSWKLQKHPIELFAEAGPVLQMTPNGGVGADGGVGLRFYFGRRN